MATRKTFAPFHYLLCMATVLFAVPALAGDAIYTKIFSEDALNGYDTVAYFTEGKPVKGDKKYVVEYMDVHWYFSSAENKALFEADPDRYRPQYGGYCAWAVAEKKARAAGNPEFWRIVDNKLYLNYNKKIQVKWQKDIEGFIAKGDVNWPEMLNE